MMNDVPVDSVRIVINRNAKPGLCKRQAAGHAGLPFRKIAMPADCDAQHDGAVARVLRNLAAAGSPSFDNFSSTARPPSAAAGMIDADIRHDAEPRKSSPATGSRPRTCRTGRTSGSASAAQSSASGRIHARRRDVMPDPVDA